MFVKENPDRKKMRRNFFIKILPYKITYITKLYTIDSGINNEV